MRPQKKELMELAATVFLIIVLILVVVRAAARVGNAKRPRSSRPAQVVKQAKPQVRKSGTLGTAAPQGGTLGTAADLWKKLQEDGKALKMKRDPFTGISFVPLQKSETLSGILWSKEHPMAIIDEAIVKVGDKIGVNTVTHIKQDSVILNDGVKETQLRLE